MIGNTMAGMSERSRSMIDKARYPICFSEYLELDMSESGSR